VMSYASGLPVERIAYQGSINRLARRVRTGGVPPARHHRRAEPAATHEGSDRRCLAGSCRLGFARRASPLIRQATFRFLSQERPTTWVPSRGRPGGVLQGSRAGQSNERATQ
jgi:hypothetical protein